jgi:hypothetical protein
MTRTLCIPAQPCSQSAGCARHDPRRCNTELPPIDASNLRHTGGLWCPMFVDARFRDDDHARAHVLEHA